MAVASALLLLLAAGCTKEKQPEPKPAPQKPAATAAAKTPTGTTTAAAPSLPAPHPAIAQSCQACHTGDLLVQQRITPKQWEEVVKKMIGWGAVIDPATGTQLAAWLAERYGPETAEYEPVSISAAAAVAELEPLPDGPFADGDAEKGAATFMMRCQVCHGPDAKGGIGVNLSDEPILYRAADFAATVRTGRGQMPPAPDLQDQDLANVLAHLRKLPGYDPAAAAAPDGPSTPR